MLLGRELSNVGEKAIVRRGGYSWRTHYRAGEYHRNLCTRWNLGDKGFVVHGVWNESNDPVVVDASVQWPVPFSPMSQRGAQPKPAHHPQAPPGDEPRSCPPMNECKDKRIKSFPSLNECKAKGTSQFPACE